MVTIKRDRYIAFRLISKADKIEESDIKSLIWKTYKNIFGLFGSSGSGLYFDNYDEIEKAGIISCTHTSLTQLLTVLALITELNGIKMMIHVLNVSGTIKNAKQSLTTK
jgi:ribonuclease P/MRP protein subunit POP5